MTTFSLELPTDVAADTAWVFPGQGAQHVGMGRDLVEAVPVAATVFAVADEALGYPLSKICFEGPEDELTRTEHTQPALVVHAIAALASAIDLGVITTRPAFVAGHSLGEYAALIAAGAVSFADGVRLVRERGRLMQAACDAEAGTMAAVLGLEPDALEAITRAAGASICNINAPGNITIGGPVEAVGVASNAAMDAGATRVVPLSVAGAFHTPMMQSAEDGLRTVLADAAFADPQLPVISNVTAQPIEHATPLINELAEQVTSPVLWLDSVLAMQAAGVTNAIEFGPGRILGGLLRRIDRSLTSSNFGTTEDLDAALGEAGEGA
jgi:[acyl-carrier-protein] S-malonyltransferase